MYTKCGSLESAYEVFRRIQDKPLASWNCMITGFAIYSWGKEAISLFNKMREAEKRYEGRLQYRSHERYSCMVGLLGRAGYLDEAWDFVQTMPIEPHSTVWGALLGSCRVHKNLELAEIAAKNLFKLKLHNPANYSVDRVEKEKVLLTHTEKLAVTYGLLKTSGGAPIRLIKNTRVCSNCHTFAKYVSLMKCRKILLKDGVRFHHFREGNDFLVTGSVVIGFLSIACSVRQ
ncbi:pentatricopeptide (PPR) repeat-containing protein [Actinidia rufa]|uniref:Pentatricopeptide (PPR) repeat-containing protein n=1 Tax=Actinidia rufa TaxID=165716 RepID=A0A7J0F291_9ERIC|nr:pentatricopeptide (PPR) repeat-containing protein [Actinidia rufa]